MGKKTVEKVERLEKAWALVDGENKIVWHKQMVPGVGEVSCPMIFETRDQARRAKEYVKRVYSGQYCKVMGLDTAFLGSTDLKNPTVAKEVILC